MDSITSKAGWTTTASAGRASRYDLGRTTVYGFPYIVLGYVDPFVDGGSRRRAARRRSFSPPTVVPGSDTGSISGQKYHDLNGNGVHDPNEPGLIGGRLRLQLNGGGGRSQLTTSIDINEDGVIDPSESGLYSFEGLAGDL
jgi:hypothetical protein